MHMNEEQKKELEEQKKELEELKRKIRESLNRIAQFEKELREEPEELLPSGASSPDLYYYILESGVVMPNEVLSCSLPKHRDNFNCYANKEEAEREAKYLQAIRVLRRCAELENAKAEKIPCTVWVVMPDGYAISAVPSLLSTTTIAFDFRDGAERAIRELKQRGLWETLTDEKK